MGAGVAETPPQMLHQRRCLGRVVVKVTGLVQYAPVPCLPQIGVCSGDQPERIIIESAAYRQIPPLCQRLILMVRTAVRELGGGNVQNALAGTSGNHVHEAQQILTGIPEPHASSHPAFKVAGGTAHIKGDHALVLVPDIDHPVQLFVAAGYPEAGEQFLPPGCKVTEGPVKGLVVRIPCHHGFRPSLVDNTQCFPFFLLGVFHISKTADQAPAFAGGQSQVKLLRGNGLPAMGYTAGAAVSEYGFRPSRASVYTDKGIPGGVESVRLPVCPEEGKVIPPLPVLGLVVDRSPFHLHLAGGVVALEIGGVIHGIPETELNIRKQGWLLLRLTIVPQSHTHEQTVVSIGNEQFLRDVECIPAPFDHRVSQPVPAQIMIQLRLGGLPAGIPYGPAVADIQAEALGVQRTGVVTVACDAPQPRITVEGITAGGVGAQSKKVLASQIVDPRQGRAGCMDHIFPPGVIKRTISHFGYLRKRFSNPIVLRLSHFSKKIKTILTVTIATAGSR